MFDLSSDVFRVICLLITVVPAVWLAEKSSRSKVFDTLQQAKAETLTRAGVASVEIDHANSGLCIELSDGYGFSVLVNTLHQKLTKLPGKAEKQAAVVTFVDQFIEATALPKLSVKTLDLLYPMLIGANPHLNPSLQNLTKAHRRELAPGLANCLVLQTGIRLAYLTEADILEAGFAEPELRDIAATNLRRRLGEVEVNEVSTDPWVSQISLEDFFDGALMLLPEVWDDLTAKHGPVAVACPQVGTLLVTEAGSAKGIDHLGQLNADFMEDAIFPVSYGIYLWRDGAWVLRS